MNKSYIFRIFLLMLLPLLGACSQEEIVFEVEKPHFDLRDGYQLLEVIVPQGTLATDKIYIVGEFNGGLEAAVGNPEWELEKSATSDAKWGIYLNPATFVNGKTLADGYTFYNAEQGEERSLENEPVLHTEAPAVGSRINVMVYRWADYFNTPEDPGEIDHDGYVVYVVDNTGWDELAMYAWGDAEAFGGWPGITPTGKVEIDGVNYKYFDTGADHEGMNLNLIFNNNNNGKQLGDYNVTLNQDFYLELTADGVTVFDPSAVVKHDGYAVFVYDATGWDELYLYMWGSTNDLNGAWPGMAPTGTQTINGLSYTYFDMGEGNCNAGLTEHVILNNGAGKQIDDAVVFDLDRDVYIYLTSNKATEIDPNDFTPEPVEPSEPDEPVVPVEPKECKIYVDNQSGWEPLYMYSWGDDFEGFGAWPGSTTTVTETIDGVTYLVFTVTGAGQTQNLIFNNNNGAQFNGPAVVLDGDHFVTAKAPETEEQ